MLTLRARSLPWCAAIACAVAACSGAGSLKSDAPETVSLAGLWRLDRAHSDDPRKVVDQLYSKSRYAHVTPNQPEDDQPDEDDTTGPPGGDGGGRGGRRRHSGAGEPGPVVISPNTAAREEAYQRAALMRALSTDAARGDQLAVRQGADSFVLDYGASVRRFTPGGHSVVSVEGGVADQHSGWKNKEYIIEVKPQVGPSVLERYSLSADGRQLIENLRVGGGGLPVVQLRRVFDHTDTLEPRATPNND
ncbi:MAG TPA: hypothetical protein VJQ47_18075 [Steroidobacteraceae bacterium]|nr:hypothetical protein [Steroidobacteraceae bacterium]